MMIMDCGSSDSLITVSEVWMSTELSPGSSGTTGRLPAAMTTRSASIVSPMPTSSSRGPTKRARASKTVTFWLR